MPGNIVGLVRYLPWSNITLTCNAEHVQICPWRPCFGWLVPFAPPHLGCPVLTSSSWWRSAFPAYISAWARPAHSHFEHWTFVSIVHGYTSPAYRKTYLPHTVPQPHKSQETQLVSGLGVSGGVGKDEWVECVRAKGRLQGGQSLHGRGLCSASQPTSHPKGKGGSSLMPQPQMAWSLFGRGVPSLPMTVQIKSAPGLTLCHTLSLLQPGLSYPLSGV